MPNLEEHCQKTLERYGVEGREIHRLIDELVRVYGPAHRQFRHDRDYAKFIGMLAEDIVLSHILLDKTEKKPEALSCSYCGAPLDPKKPECSYCKRPIYGLSQFGSILVPELDVEAAEVVYELNKREFDKRMKLKKRVEFLEGKPFWKRLVYALAFCGHDFLTIS